MRVVQRRMRGGDPRGHGTAARRSRRMARALPRRPMAVAASRIWNGQVTDWRAGCDRIPGKASMAEHISATTRAARQACVHARARRCTLAATILGIIVFVSGASEIRVLFGISLAGIEYYRRIQRKR
jgi:hypothetical protein